MDLKLTLISEIYSLHLKKKTISSYNCDMDLHIYSYGHLLVITSYFNGIIHSINGVFVVLLTGKGP